MQHQEKALKKMFNPDQLQALTRKSTKGMTWGIDTVKKALRLRFSCGSSGYTDVRSSGIPLPSIRTLQMRLQSIPFSPGVLPSVFQYLQEKVCSTAQSGVLGILCVVMVFFLIHLLTNVCV